MEKLSGIDASFLYLETDTMHMQIAFLLICDASDVPGGYSYQKIVEIFESKTETDAAFRRRLVKVPFNLGHPVWIDDPDYDVYRHIRRWQLSSDGTGSRRQLGKVAGEIISKPLHKDRPLWEAWVIEGLEHNCYALMLKAHHAAVDGVAGTRLARRLLDLEPTRGVHSSVNKLQGERIPSSGQLLNVAWNERAKQMGVFSKLLGSTVKGAYNAFGKGNKHPGVFRSRPLDAPPTHFNKRIGRNRDVGFVEISLSRVKTIKNALDCTVNDVILGLCGGVVRTYLQKKNDLPDKSLTAMVPISVHKPGQDSEIANHISSMWATIATHIEDPIERIRIIHKDTVCAKEEMNAIGAEFLQDWAEYSQGGVFNVAVRMYTQLGFANRMAPHNLIVSNVPGPRETLYLGESKVDSMFILGPVMESVGLNITLVSYQDSIGFSVHVDPGLIEDVEQISGLFHDELKRLEACASPKKRASKKGAAV